MKQVIICATALVGVVGRTAVIAALLTVSACDGGSDPPPPAGPVLFIGDSITAHWDLSAVANPTLAELVPGSIIDGVGGATSQQLDFSSSVTLLPATALPTALPHSPSVVVIEAGTNDLVQVGVYNLTHSPAYPPPSTIWIQDMANRAAQSGAHVLIASVVETAMPQYGVSAADITAFNAELQTLCDEFGYTYVNYQPALQLPDGTQDMADFEPDGVHPNATGYAAMWEVLQPLIE